MGVLVLNLRLNQKFGSNFLIDLCSFFLSSIVIKGSDTLSFLSSMIIEGAMTFYFFK